MCTTSQLSRRRFFELASGGLAAGVIATPLLLEACAPLTRAPAGPTIAPAGSNVSTRVKLPAYVPFQSGPAPDLPGSATGVEPAYFKFPSALIRSVAEPPGDGSEVSGITMLPFGTPPPLEKNAAWQAVNKQLGVTLRLIFAPAGDYPAKINTLVSGSDLPDFIYNQPLGTFGVIAALPEFVRAKCEDLTPYLSGDAVKDYPNLANYSTYSWQAGVVAGGIYGVPISRGPFGNVFVYRDDLTAQVGLSGAPGSADELKRMLIALTRPADNQWGLATSGPPLGIYPASPFLSLFRAPNNWRLNADGTLVKDLETAEYREAVGFVRDLFAAGVYHPNSLTYSPNSLDVDFRGGRSAVEITAWGAYLLQWGALAGINPTARMRPMQPFAHDGGQPMYHAGPGHFGVTFVKKSSPERLKLLLRILNVLAAPFGTEEWLVNFYGLKDIDYTFDANGAPAPTPQGRAETALPLRYITSPPTVLFDPAKSRDFATVGHAAEEAMVATRLVDPTLNLYSATGFKLGLTAQMTFLNGISEIVQGHRPLSDLDQLIADWRRTAGDTMRNEYQTALAAAKA